MRSGVSVRGNAWGGAAVDLKWLVSSSFRIHVLWGKGGKAVPMCHVASGTLAVGLVLLPIIYSADAWAETNYLRRSLYPAQVRSVTMPYGATLDSANSIQRAEWTIQFGNKLPTAVYYNNSSGVEIQGLVCVSSYKGKKECSISIPADRKVCILFPGTREEALQDWEKLVCPSSLEFAR